MSENKNHSNYHDPMGGFLSDANFPELQFKPDTVQSMGLCPDLVTDETMRLTQPDWETWKHIRRATLRDAVSLALNLNPLIFSAGAPISQEELIQEHPDYSNEHKRLSNIAWNRSKEFSHEDFDADNPMGTAVDLTSFGRFVESLGEPYALPANFPRVEVVSEEKRECVEIPANAEVDQLSPPYMTSKLRALFEIMREIDENPGVKSIEIVKEKTGLGTREATVIASIINKRPDGRSGKWPAEDLA